jgi:hypothetical protein
VYSEEARKCKRVNPCRSNATLCGDNGRCQMTRGGHTCLCHEGFQLDEGELVCKDFDECSVDNGSCEHVCVNLEGTHECKCRKGFAIRQEDLTTCDDMDECSTGAGINNCQQICINTRGSYICACEENYEVDEADLTKCAEIIISDPCAHCSHACNEEGQCVCPRGYRLNRDGMRCSVEQISAQQGCRQIEAALGMQIKCSQDLGEGETYPKGTICRGRCAIGYLSDGNGRLKQKCRKDGSWSGTYGGSCASVACPRLELGTGVSVSPGGCAESDSPVRQRCKFSCPKGEQLLGSRASRCRRDGVWKHNGGPPKCVAIQKAATSTTTTTTTASTTTAMTSTTTDLPWIATTTASRWKTTPRWGKFCTTHCSFNKTRLN